MPFVGPVAETTTMDSLSLRQKVLGFSNPLNRDQETWQTIQELVQASRDVVIGATVFDLTYYAVRAFVWSHKFIEAAVIEEARRRAPELFFLRDHHTVIQEVKSMLVTPDNEVALREAAREVSKLVAENASPPMADGFLFFEKVGSLIVVPETEFITRTWNLLSNVAQELDQGRMFGIHPSFSIKLEPLILLAVYLQLSATRTMSTYRTRVLSNKWMDIDLTPRAHWDPQRIIYQFFVELWGGE